MPNKEFTFRIDDNLEWFTLVLIGFQFASAVLVLGGCFRLAAGAGSENQNAEDGGKSVALDDILLP